MQPHSIDVRTAVERWDDHRERFVNRLETAIDDLQMELGRARFVLANPADIHRVICLAVVRALTEEQNHHDQRKESQP